MALVILHTEPNFQGQGVAIDDDVPYLQGFNDILASVAVQSGTFTLYEHADYGGWSITVCAKGGPNSDGQYPDASSMGGHTRAISSIRRNSDEPS